MREVRLSNNIFDFINLLSVRVEKEVNRHAELEVCGTIPWDMDEAVLNKAGKSIVFSASDDSGAQKIFFCRIHSAHRG